MPPVAIRPLGGATARQWRRTQIRTVRAAMEPGRPMPDFWFCRDKLIALLQPEIEYASTQNLKQQYFQHFLLSSSSFRTLAAVHRAEAVRYRPKDPRRHYRHHQAMARRPL